MKQKLLPRVGRRLLTLVAILMMVVSSAFAGTVSDAQKCYDTVTNPEYRVDDATHNALYAALKALIDSNSTDSDAIDAAIENAYRQYYYDFVATDVIVYTNYLKKEVVREDDSDDAAINAFKAALETATTTYGDGNINLETPSATYKEAHEKLTAAFQALLEKQYANAKKALETEIANANTAKGTLAYDENKKALQAYIDAASTTAPVTRAGVKQLRAAKTTLAQQTASVVATDKAQALDALKTSITNATTRKGEIAVLSTVVADELTAPIATATAVRDNDNSAKVRVEAAKTLDAAVVTVNADLDAHQASKKALSDAITAATTAKNAYTATHTGVIAQAQDAINKAQAVLDDAVSKSKAELDDATKALNTAKEAADAANTAATNLETAISTANTTKASILDASVKANVEKKVDEAKAMLQDKTKTAAELDAAAKALTDYVQAQVTEDIDIARTALSKAIAAATTAKDDLGYDENKSDLATAITKATGVKDNAKATAAELTAAKTTLENAQATIKATDDAKAKTDLAAAITAAKAKKTSLETLADKLAKYPEELSLFNTNVVNDLATAITTAQGVQDNAASTGKQKVEQVKKLNTAITDADTSLKLYYNTQCQKLADEYTADKNLNIVVENDVTVLSETADFTEAFAKAEDVYSSVKSKEDTYDVIDVILARKDLETAATALKKAYNAWKDAANALNAKIAEANTALGTIQLPVHKSIYEALNNAIQTAKGVYDNKKATTTADLTAAYNALDKALNNAIVEDTEWSFTDATPDYKAGVYGEGKVTYTRSGSAIAEGNYGTFCLPFEVATSNFKAAYTPIEVSVLSADGNTLTLFLNEVEAETIPAYTPFFAELKAPETAETLVLNNATATEVGETIGDVITTNINVYNKKDGSSLTTLNKEMKFQWTGTLAKTTEVEKSYVFRTNGSFAPAANYISPFRAYLHMVDNTYAARDLNIVVDFGGEDEATAIINVAADAESGNGKIYTIDGKVANSMSNKGVYIINGKKFVK